MSREVLLEGPDGVAVNLVQPLGGPDTFTGRIRAQVERHGMTRTGFTPICTTAHCLYDMSASVSFYRDVLGMRVVLDEVLGKPETNYFLARPPNARAHTVFVAGDHFFGKVALNQPLNYEVAERLPQAHAPNVGYLAQGFAVPDLGEAVRRLEQTGTPYQWRPVPPMREFGGERLVQLRVPGSGGFALLYERA
jgi:catechol 2,3-dioxygenase-like lactoylglutathione lyase family enzyme